MPSSNTEIAFNGANWIEVPGVPQTDADQIQQLLSCLKQGKTMEQTAGTFPMSRSTLHSRIKEWTQKGYMQAVQLAVARENAVLASSVGALVLDSYHGLLTKVIADGISDKTSAKTRLEIVMFLTENYIKPALEFREDPGSAEQNYVDGHSGNFTPTQIPAVAQTEAPMPDSSLDDPPAEDPVPGFAAFPVALVD